MSSKITQILKFLRIVLSKSKNTQIILVCETASTLDLLSVLEATVVFRLIDNYREPRLGEILTAAQENYAQIEQSQQLFELLNDQNANLIKLSKELEDRVAKRQQTTIKSREKLMIANQRTEGLERALIALNKARNISEIETLVREAVCEAFNIDWIKIDILSNPFNKQVVEHQTKDIVFSCPLYQGSAQIGTVFFGRAGSRPFSTNQEGFLTQVAESISLAVFRLNNLRHFEVLKSQWEASFDAITRPLCLIDSSYTIIRSNKAFATGAGLTNSEIVGQKCYEMLFKRSQPCLNCHLGKKFRLPKLTSSENRPVIFDVTSQLLHSGGNGSPLFINIYHDVTESLRLEVQILESSREAEIGLIGSSIAHELNNPLAGIIAFIQVIKMDLKPTDSYFNDILEMEKAALRCKEIISNLLGFSRLTSFNDAGIVDLREVLKQSKEIFQLRAKSSGVEISLSLPEKQTKMEGQINLLIQALGHLITMALATIVDERNKDKTINPMLFIELDVTLDTYLINFSTSYPLKQSPKELDASTQARLPDMEFLDLQVTSQIIKDHLGQLDIISLGKFFQARVKFPRPETLPKSQEVDSEI